MCKNLLTIAIIGAALLAAAAPARAGTILPFQQWYGLEGVAPSGCCGGEVQDFTIASSDDYVCAVQGVGGALPLGDDYILWRAQDRMYTLQLVEGNAADNVHVLIGCVPLFVFTNDAPEINMMIATNGISDGNIGGISNGSPMQWGLWGSDSFCFLAGHEGNLDGSELVNEQFTPGSFWFLVTQPGTQTFFDESFCFSFSTASRQVIPTVSPFVHVSSTSPTCDLGDGQSDHCVSTGASGAFCAITGLDGTYDDPNGATFLVQPTGSPTVNLYSEHPGNSTTYAGAYAACVDYFVP